MLARIRLLRVKHYIKNLLIFVPLFFGKAFLKPEILLDTFVALIAFCMATSIVYIFNDINDVEKDRLHPTKCKRPIASGEVSLKSAWVEAGVLFIILAIFWWYGFIRNVFSVEAGLLLALYILINILYTKWLKMVPILDLVILAAGFIIRIYYGSCIAEVPISEWLYLTVLGGAFYLGMGKRRNEIKMSEGAETRGVLKYYTYEFLDKNMTASMTFTVVFYALWAILVDIEHLVWTVPMIMVIFMRYSLLIERGDSEGNPIDVLLRDKILLVLALLYSIMMVAFIYFS